MIDNKKFILFNGFFVIFSMSLMALNKFFICFYKIINGIKKRLSIINSSTKITKIAYVIHQ